MTRNRRPSLTALLGALCSIALGLTTAPAATAGVAHDLAVARAGTAAFHNIAAATGYGLFTDAAGIACIDKPGVGTMGVHYVKGALVGDGAVNAATPEALVYEPTKNGRLRLVAVEYVVFQADWDATHSSPPSLFGQTFDDTGAENRYGLPPYYSLHAWIWKNNPDGMFKDWNPEVTCANA
ncbi:MAG: hypothetical protein ABJA93_00275 [Sporichthyaceae bacterium]